MCFKEGKRKRQLETKIACKTININVSSDLPFPKMIYNLQNDWIFCFLKNQIWKHEIRNKKTNIDKKTKSTLKINAYLLQVKLYIPFVKRYKAVIQHMVK